MHCSAIRDRAPDECPSSHINGNVPRGFPLFRCVAEARDRLEYRTILASNDARISPAQAGCRFNQCVKHSLQVEGRAADDLEHVCCGGLLLQGFAKFIEQSRVFDRDNSLLGKVGDEFDLFVGERPHFLAVNAYCSE